MRKIVIQASFFILMILVGFFPTSIDKTRASGLAQQPTLDFPTVTGTPEGPIARVNQDQPQINVRSGPDIDYPKIGVLIAGQEVPALGKSVAGLWIQIVYPGVESGVAWVYSPLVTVTRVDELRIIEPPALPTPLVTPTIDPTLAAQFIVEIPATRLPTFTPGVTLAIPTYVNESIEDSSSVLPPAGLFITLFGVVGLIGMVVSLLRGR
ncbi:MAG: SH3 domain-containing protein [Chloroflexi bacterium]|nr:SH3 domain-containing protein [Chloroflexota bacterium]